MGLLDSLLGSALGGGQDKHSALADIAMKLISGQSSGSGNGLAGLAQQFDQKGLGDLMQSWIGTGENKAISGEQLQHALGSEKVQAFAQQTGLGGGDVTSALAKLLPQLIDKVTPQGKIPEGGGLQSMLAGLLGGAGR